MLTEQKILGSIKRNVIANTIDVEWYNQILRDGEIISSIPHNGAYGADQKAQLLADCPEAAADVEALGWQ